MILSVDIGQVSTALIVLGAMALGLGLFWSWRDGGEFVSGVARVVGKDTKYGLLFGIMDLVKAFSESPQTSSQELYYLVCVLIENGEPQGNETTIYVLRRSFESIEVGQEIEVYYRAGQESKLRLASENFNAGPILTVGGITSLVIGLLLAFFSHASRQ